MDDRTRFSRNDDVLGLNGEKIGTVSEVGPTYLHVATGILGLGKSYFVPFDAVTRVEDHRVYLNVAKAELSAQDWGSPPAEMAGPAPGSTSPGMYGTMPAQAAPVGTAEPTPRTWLTIEDVQGKMLCDFDGVEIGRVDDGSPDYVHATTGVAGLGPDFYAPLTAINDCTGDRCFLNVPIAEIRTLGWNQSFGGTSAGTAAAGPIRPGDQPSAADVELAEGEAAFAGETENDVRIHLDEEEAVEVERLTTPIEPASEAAADQTPPPKQRRAGD